MDKLAAFIVIVVVVASWDFPSRYKAQSMANQHAPECCNAAEKGRA